MTEGTKSRREQAEQMFEPHFEKAINAGVWVHPRGHYLAGFLDSDKTRVDEIKKCMEVLTDFKDMVEHAIALDYLGEGSTSGWAKRCLEACEKLKGGG